MSVAGDRRARVGVVPAWEREARGLLFDALEAALPVRFEGRGEEAAVADLDAVVAFGGHRTAEPHDGPPRLLAQREERAAAGAARPVALARVEALDRRLRGARLTERWAHGPVVAPEGALVLARGEEGPQWAVVASSASAPAGAAGADALRRAAPGGGARSRRAFRGRDVLAPAPAELAPGEALRDRLVPGRSLALLALVHFLREIAAEHAYAPPPLQAAFIVDDPNLHWPRYGHLDYRALAAHAAEHRYHLAIAMVPLDGWLVHPGAARLFREHPEALSIVVHGNDHAGRELARPGSAAEGRALADAALRRVAAFERRAGVAVGRVMVPPHERIAEPAARGLLGAGFEAACMSRPYPWIAEPGRPFLARPAEAGPLVGWRPADAVAGGLPVLLRNTFGHPREDLVLRAFLDQPLLLYGHHGDLAGLDALAEAAAQVNRLGDVAWRPLPAIARAAADTRRAGATLHVRPWTRRVAVDVPAGVRRLVVEPPGELRAPGVPEAYAIEIEPPPEPAPAPRRVAIALSPPPCADAGAAPVRAGTAATPRRAWPVARRLAGEGRDRLAPVLAALGR